MDAIADIPGPRYRHAASYIRPQSMAVFLGSSPTISGASSVAMRSASPPRPTPTSPSSEWTRTTGHSRVTPSSGGPQACLTVTVSMLAIFTF